MAVKLPNASRSAMANALVDLIDGGAAAGYVEIRSGAGPADPDSAADGDLLVTIPLNDAAFGAAADGVATIDSDPALSAAATGDGIAGWARFYDSDDASVLDLDVGEGSGSLSLDNTDIAVDQVVTITGGTITMPDGQ